MENKKSAGIATIAAMVAGIGARPIAAGQCKACADGKWSTNGAASCSINCPRGYYCKDGAKTKCETDKYCPQGSSNDSAAWPTPAVYREESSSGEVSYPTCEAGHWCANGVKTRCGDHLAAICTTEGRASAPDCDIVNEFIPNSDTAAKCIGTPLITRWELVNYDGHARDSHCKGAANKDFCDKAESVGEIHTLSPGIYRIDGHYGPVDRLDYTTQVIIVDKNIGLKYPSKDYAYVDKDNANFKTKTSELKQDETRSVNLYTPGVAADKIIHCDQCNFAYKLKP